MIMKKIKPTFILRLIFAIYTYLDFLKLSLRDIIIVKHSHGILGVQTNKNIVNTQNNSISLCGSFQ